MRPPGQHLPNMVVALRGQVSVDLVGRVTIPGGTRLAARFTDVPDVPMRRFVLRFHAGSRGVVGLGGGLCSPRLRSSAALVQLHAQTAAALDKRGLLGVGGCGLRPSP